jgi:methyl-accepting chemotaxis protein
MDTDTTENGSGTLAPPKFRRRNYIVDSRGQLTSTFKVAGLVAVLLVLLNLVYAWLSRMQTLEILASSPELRDTLNTTDTRGTIIIASISLIFLALVVVRAIMLTHRTAGAAFNITNKLERVAAGNYDTNLKLRLKDNLRELEAPFNKMTSSLRRSAKNDAEVLSRLADDAAEAGNADIAEKLRKLAESKGRSSA